MTHNKQAGFTLVEMAIVITIIGLIIGGILAGQDLIQSARVRATISQISTLDTNINAFYSKYDAVPGDMKDAQRKLNSDPSTFEGNGNGVIEYMDGQAQNFPASYDYELHGFYEHLALAEISAFAPEDLTSDANVEEHFPKTKLRKGGIITYTDGSKNYYLVGIGNLSGGAFPATFQPTDRFLSPEEAFGIDSKLDDGKTTTGGTLALKSLDSTDSNIGGTLMDEVDDDTECTQPGETAASPREYNLLYDGNVCIIRVRAQG